MERQKPQNSQHSIEEEEQVGRLIHLTLGFIIIQTVWYWPKKTQTHRSMGLAREPRNRPK